MMFTKSENWRMRSWIEASNHCVVTPTPYRPQEVYGLHPYFIMSCAVPLLILGRTCEEYMKREIAPAGLARLLAQRRALAFTMAHKYFFDLRSKITLW